MSEIGDSDYSSLRPTDEFHNIGDKHLSHLEQVRRDFYSRVVAFDVLMMNVYKLILAYLSQHKAEKNITVFDVTALHMGKSIRTFESIRILLKNGFEQDAYSLLRNLCDINFSLLYLQKDLTNAQRFRDWADIERYKQMDNRKKLGQTDLLSAALMQDLENKHSKFKNTWNRIGPSWMGKNTLELAKCLKRESDYLSVYSIASKFSHTTYISINHYMDGKSPMWGPSDNQTSKISIISVEAFVDVFVSFIEIHELVTESLGFLLNEIRGNVHIFTQFGDFASPAIIKKTNEPKWIRLEDIPEYLDLSHDFIAKDVVS